jgi:hypothetical protein
MYFVAEFLDALANVRDFFPSGVLSHRDDHGCSVI